ncbi:unnamed protein product [Amoebophrya sp. A120]|nr:unnamed protein product [Amoebophrya sp. A120]|eukprot:GSA120T00009515001.1
MPSSAAQAAASSAAAPSKPLDGEPQLRRRSRSPRRNGKHKTENDGAAPESQAHDVIEGSARSSTLPSQLQGLIGLWRSSDHRYQEAPVRCYLRDAMEDGLLHVEWADGSGSSSKIRLVTGGLNKKSKSTLFTIQLENPGNHDFDEADNIAHRWMANGVTATTKEILWHNKKPKDGAHSPITWTRIFVPPREVAAADSVCEKIEKAQQETARTFEKLRADIEEAEKRSKTAYEKLRSDVSGNLLADQVPCCKICMTNPIGVVLLGCGHVLCEECAEQQCTPGKPCFYCKVPYAGRQEMFFS